MLNNGEDKRERWNQILEMDFDGEDGLIWGNEVEDDLD